MNSVEKNYDRAIQQEQPGGFTGHGREEVTDFWNTLISAFPDSQFTIEHISFTEEKDQAKKSCYTLVFNRISFRKWKLW